MYRCVYNVCKYIHVCIVYSVCMYMYTMYVIISTCVDCVHVHICIQCTCTYMYAMHVSISRYMCTCISLFQAIWEWGDPDKGEWHPFERDTNIQIEEMYDSGSQWAELTLCIPSPMLLLLNLQDMKLVNSRTTTRYCLRRVDNSSNMTPVGGSM